MEVENKLTKRELKIKKKFGVRPHKGAIPIDEPMELGYRCPKGHANITWSEFKEHIWCYKCKKDFHYADECVMIKHRFNPKDLPKQPKMIYGIANYTLDGNHFYDVPKNLL